MLWALCCLAHRELAWLFHEPHAGLDDCLRMLQACFRKMMSAWRAPAARSRTRRPQSGRRRRRSRRAGRPSPGAASRPAGRASPSTTWRQFKRIFRPPNRRPKDERLWVGDELGNDLGHDLGGQKILLNCHPGQGHHLLRVHQAEPEGSERRRRRWDRLELIQWSPLNRSTV